MNGPEPQYCGQITPQTYGQWPQHNIFTTTDIDLRTEEQKQVDDENNLKVEINTFVWTHAPEQMTLGKADELACKILSLFIEANEELKTKIAAAWQP